MAIYNVKVGNLVVPMDLESEHDVRRNIQYIGKVLGFKPKDLISTQAGISGPGVGLKYDIRLQGASDPFPGGTSLKQNAVQAHLPQVGEHHAANPGDSFAIPGARTIELFDPKDANFEPPYPSDRFAQYQAPIGNPDAVQDMPVKNV